MPWAAALAPKPRADEHISSVASERHVDEEFHLRNGHNCRSAAAAVGSASPTVAAPSGVGTAQDTVKSLQADGYTIILKKVGNAPLDECTVSAVQPDHTSSEMGSGSPAVCLRVSC
jgi:hypothetical protein